MRLCQFGQNLPIGSEDSVQTRNYADSDEDADTDTIRTKTSMSPLPFGLGYIIN